MGQNEINDKKLKELQEWFKKEAESGRPWIFLLLLAIFMPKDVLENLRGGENMSESKEYSASEKAVEYARKLEGITFLEWKILSGAMHQAFGVKERELERNIKLSLDEDLIDGDHFRF